MNSSIPEAYFVDGGTLRANTPSYVKRPADDELFDALIDREYCYILTPRQMGKSSLMIRTSQRLKEHNVKTATVDIQGIGTNRIREWYASLLSQIRRGLKLSLNIDDWMTKKSNVGFGQLFMDFIQDVVLTEISEQIVIFLDEVDWMIKIDFRDDFFASLRSMYNARAQYPEFNRISFVLLGVASPADLISEPTRTPFNIGHAIPLQELSLKDATPLQDGLEQVCPGEGKRMLERIFYWTNGHPYLTQKICKSIAETSKVGWSDSEVDDLVHRLFLAEESRKEANLKFIQDRILSNEQFAQLLKLYKRVRQSKIKESGQSILQNQLMLSGLLTSSDGYLEVRNRIYRTVFNERWINQNTPKNWQRIALAVMGTIMTVALAIFVYDFIVNLQANNCKVNFYSAGLSGNPPVGRLSNLACLYRLNGILPGANPGDTAHELFYGLQADDQLAMFNKPYFEESRVDWQNDLITVIAHLYITIADVEPDNDDTALLQTMYQALGHVPNNEIASGLREEIGSWLNGRQKYREGNYESALADYTNAITLNADLKSQKTLSAINPATFYERAKVHIALKDYASALQDLDAAIGAAKQSAPNLPTATPTLTPAITASMTDLPTLTATSAVISPTPLSTQTPSPTSIPSLLPTPSSPGNPVSFESHFSTLIDVVNAVQGLINRTPELQDQISIQSNGESTYTNLRSYGLIRSYPSTSACDKAELVTDVTVPDGTRFDPGATFTKTWRLKNVGTCTWTTSYQLVFDSGTQMGAPSTASFAKNVAVGETVDISVNMTAPSVGGSYRGYWRFKNAEGVLFGIGPNANRSWWVDIKVSGTTLTTGSTVEHQIVDGEWLVQIARCYGADLNAVQSANPQIKDSKANLLSGTVIVPNIGSNGAIYGPPCVMNYTVQAGDTWESIAQKYNADLAVLQQRNLEVSFSTGVQLLIPLNSAGGNPQPDIPLEFVSIVGAGTFNAEMVIVRNNGTEPLNLSSWQLKDADGQVFTFPNLTLNSGSVVQIHSVSGTNTIIDLYWGKSEPVWQPGEEAQLLDASGNLRAMYQVPIMNAPVPTSTPAQSIITTPQFDVVYVDTDYTGSEDGSITHPYNTLNEGITYARSVPAGAYIYIKQADGTWRPYAYFAPINPGPAGGS